MDYNQLASKESLEKTRASLVAQGYDVVIASNRQEALEKIKSLIPPKASVMNGASVTLEQIGFIDYLKSKEHQWRNFHETILAESDKEAQANLRKLAVHSDFYLGSVHALAETGEFVIASNTGSQLPHVVFTSPNLIFVVSTKKIVPTVEEGLARVREYVVPLEDKHMMEKYGVGTHPNKMLIFNGENPMLGRKIHFILVEENLGF